MDKTTISRRMALMGLAALAACGAPPRKSDRWASADNPGFDAWLAGFHPKGVGRDALAQARYIPAVIEKDRNQAESKLPLSEYLAIATSYERVGMGRQKLVSHAAVLQQIQDHYRVDAPVIAAIWGLESLYGSRRGEVPVISALATLAYDGRRRAFFEQQLTAALKILAAGDVRQSQMLGSWAGAMGHTQFIPTSYLAFAVDFNRDGRRDIWSDDPTDSLASTAAYLARSGWQLGQPWGQEVVLPAGVRAGRRDMAQWADLGLRGLDRPLPGQGMADLVPNGKTGFLIYGNARAIRRYNNAQAYVIGVGHLSDVLRSGAVRA